MAGQSDLYTQFFVVTNSTDASNSTTLTHTRQSTGLSIDGNRFWLIHAIDYDYTITHAASNRMRSSLAVTDTFTAFPEMDQPGVIDVNKFHATIVTQGISVDDWVRTANFLPPIPIANPNITLYNNTSVDNVAHRNVETHARIRYTTIPANQATILEVSQLWANIR